MPQMIIANRLTDGLVIYMGGEGAWVDSINEGALLQTEAETERWLAVAEKAVEDCEVVDPYLIEVNVDHGKRRPQGARETIRAFGPSVRTDLLDAQGAGRGTGG